MRLCISHTSRPVDFSRVSTNFLVGRYADPERLRRLPPLTSLSPRDAPGYIGNITVWDLADDPLVQPRLIAFQKRSYKAQHAVLLGERLVICGTEHLEICDLSGTLLSQRSDPWFTDGHTVCRSGPDEVVVSCSCPDAVLTFDLNADGGAASAVRIPEPWYGHNFDIPRDADLRRHYISNDQQRTHINNAVPCGDGFLVSMLIPGAVGLLGRDGTYRELTRGFVGCHGARTRPGLEGFYFSDSCQGTLVEMDWSGRVVRRFSVDSRWLHDCEWLVGDVYLFCLSDANSVQAWDVARGSLVWSMPMAEYGVNTQFSSVERDDGEWRPPAPARTGGAFSRPAADVSAVVVPPTPGSPPSAHHRIIRNFPVSTLRSDDTFAVDFVGARHRRSFFDPAVPGCPTGEWGPWLPPSDEEYFEWIAVLAAVEAAVERVTLIELGAGWGRWMLRGAAAARLRGKRFRLVGAEPDPDHFAWMQTAFEDNGIPSADSRLINAVVTGRPEEVWFHSGNPAAWYGQYVISDVRAQELLASPTVPGAVGRYNTATLESVTADLDSVDLLDMDIQGSEADVVEQSLHVLDRKVAAVYISTHGPSVEERLRTAFHSLGWVPIFDYSLQTRHATPYGPVGFRDGTQFWVRPDAEALLDCLWEPRLTCDSAARLRTAVRSAHESAIRCADLERRLADGEARRHALQSESTREQWIARCRIRELLGSRWRRLGQTLGLAGRTEWEKEFAAAEDQPPEV